MALPRVLLRALIAFVMVIVLTVIVYPLMVGALIFHIIRSNASTGFVANIFANIFLNHPDLISVRLERVEGKAQ